MPGISLRDRAFETAGGVVGGYSILYWLTSIEHSWTVHPNIHITLCSTRFYDGKTLCCSWIGSLPVVKTYFNRSWTLISEVPVIGYFRHFRQIVQAHDTLEYSSDHSGHTDLHSWNSQAETSALLSQCLQCEGGCGKLHVPIGEANEYGWVWERRSWSFGVCRISINSGSIQPIWSYCITGRSAEAKHLFLSWHFTGWRWGYQFGTSFYSQT